jgi:pilus assembly protein Flp/PilA
MQSKPELLSTPLFLERNFLMNSLKNFVVDFLSREDGPTAVEYAVMLALIIVVCITAITALGSNANKTFSSVSTTIGGTAS